MKKRFSAAILSWLLIFSLLAVSGCGSDSKTSSVPEPIKVSDQDITIDETPILLAARPEFRPEDRVREDELVSLHGYFIGMTLAEAQQVWEIPQNMVDYAKGNLNEDYPTLAIFIGNMLYTFEPELAADPKKFDDYVLKSIYYGETVFCTQREQLNVLRDIKLGVMIEDALKSLPGDRTPRKWAVDQLYGKYYEPNSAHLEYITNLGFYELRIYCENSWIRLSFGNSGKLWFAEGFSM